MEMKLIKNSQNYWQFIKELRYHPDNVHGFVTSDLVTSEEQIKYMNQYGNNKIKLILTMSKFHKVNIQIMV